MIPKPLELRINGDLMRTSASPVRTLLEFLRYDVGLTGSKQGCDKGDCGACTVLVDGKPILSCITLAHEVSGCSVETVESLAQGAALHPLQQAFVTRGAAQCGFCTPGMLMSAKALFDSSEPVTRDGIRRALAGNLCRCTGYTKIIDAVEDASDGQADSPGDAK